MPTADNLWSTAIQEQMEAAQAMVQSIDIPVLEDIVGGTDASTSSTITYSPRIYESPITYAQDTQAALLYEVAFARPESTALYEPPTMGLIKKTPYGLFYELCQKYGITEEKALEILEQFLKDRQEARAFAVKDPSLGMLLEVA